MISFLKFYHYRFFIACFNFLSQRCILIHTEPGCHCDNSSANIFFIFFNVSTNHHSSYFHIRFLLSFIWVSLFVFPCYILLPHAASFILLADYYCFFLSLCDSFFLILSFLSGCIFFFSIFVSQYTSFFYLAAQLT